MLRTQLPLLDAKLLRFLVGWCYIPIVYRDIHVQPYAISGQKCLAGMTNYSLLCTVNDTKRLRREALKNGRWHETSFNNTMTPDGD